VDSGANSSPFVVPMELWATARFPATPPAGKVFLATTVVEDSSSVEVLTLEL
jgi:hypothetical protein